MTTIGLIGSGNIVSGVARLAIDGHYPELDDESTMAAELLQAHLPESRVTPRPEHRPSSLPRRTGRKAGRG